MRAVVLGVNGMTGPAVAAALAEAGHEVGIGREDRAVTDVVVRSARPDEVAELLDLWARAGENAARPADRPEDVLRLLERDPESLLVAELDGRVVGTVIAGWDGWRANLYRLAVDPGVRGRGIAGLLVSRAEGRLRALGAGRFCAMVLEENDVGRSFWASRGYAPQEEWRRWVTAARAATS